MPMLEIRRHSKRNGDEAVHLSQEGVELARWSGTLMGPFEIVATSVAPRARETAIAMGFAVTLELPDPPERQRLPAGVAGGERTTSARRSRGSRGW